jgi:hypothetical protein
MSTHGIALRELGGSGQIEVQLRVRDFNIQEVGGPDGQKKILPVDCLIAFSSTAWRELGEGSDLWEFRTVMPSPAGPVNMLMFLLGSDILMVRSMSRLA